jgi:hypothetical protein
MVCRVIKTGQKFAECWSGIAGDGGGGKGAGGEKEESGEENRRGGFPSGEKRRGVFCTNDDASSKSRRREYLFSPFSHSNDLMLGCVRYDADASGGYLPLSYNVRTIQRKKRDVHTYVLLGRMA